MLKKTITYTDYNGLSRTEDFFFNLTKAELLEWELGTEGGMQRLLEKIVAENDRVKIVNMFKEIVLKAYGVKSPDGKRFDKVIDGHRVADDFVENRFKRRIDVIDALHVSTVSSAVSVLQNDSDIYTVIRIII